MASRRKLKKEIYNVMSELINECMVCHILLPDFGRTKLDTYVGRICEINNEFIRRINAQEHADTKRVKNYYRVLIEEFNKQTTELINDLGKEDK